MDGEGNIYASKYQRIGEFHHSSLVAGNSVAAAGELEVRNGILMLISDKCGHYKPEIEYLEQAMDVLQFQGVDVSAVIRNFRLTSPPPFRLVPPSINKNW